MVLTAIENVLILDTSHENDRTDADDANEAKDSDQSDSPGNDCLNDANSKSYDNVSLRTSTYDTDDLKCIHSAVRFENSANIVINEPVVDVTEGNKLISNETKPNATNESPHKEEISGESCWDFFNYDDTDHVDLYLHSNGKRAHCTGDPFDLNDIPNIVVDDFVVDSSEEERKEEEPVSKETEPDSTNESQSSGAVSDGNPTQLDEFSNHDRVKETGVSLNVTGNDGDEIERVEVISIEVELGTMWKSVGEEDVGIPCRSFQLPKYLKLKTNRRELICNYCQKCFLSKNTLRKHIRKHTMLKQSFNCTKCDKCFVSRSGLFLHRRKVHSPKKSSKRKRKYTRAPSKFFCSECTFKCTARSLMTAHARIHNCEKNFLLRRTSNRNTYVSDRIRSQKPLQGCTLNQSFDCGKCGKTFTTSGGLGVHRSSRTCERSLNCAKCQFRANNRNFLKYHMSTEHSARKRKFDLRDYLKNRHKIGEEFICDICGCKYRSKSSLIAHIRTHNAEKRFVCEVCDRKYVFKSSLNRHIRFQHDVDRVVCDYCRKNFGHENTLRKHIQEHLRQLKRTVVYACPLCDLKFTQRSQLENHACISEPSSKKESTDIDGQSYRHVSSTSVKESLNLTCQICDFKVDRESDMMDHFRIHTGETPFCCEICEERFSRSVDLSSHKSIHQEQI